MNVLVPEVKKLMGPHDRINLFAHLADKYQGLTKYLFLDIYANAIAKNAFTASHTTFTRITHNCPRANHG